MNYSVYAILISVFLSCGGPKTVFESKDLEIIKSSVVTIHPGVQGAPSNVDYKVEVKIMKNGIWSFGEAFMFDKKGEVFLDKNQVRVFKNNLPDASFNKGEVVMLYFSRLIYHEEGDAPTRLAVIPVENIEKAEVLLTYYKGDKMLTIGVKNIVIEETVYAP
jgi:hypothetical protein